MVAEESKSIVDLTRCLLYTSLLLLQRYVRVGQYSDNYLMIINYPASDLCPLSCLALTGSASVIDGVH